MKTRWLGTATVEIIDNTTHLLIDPYYQKNNKTQNQLLTQAIQKANAILITHPHLDHFSDIKTIVKLTNCPIYVSQKGIETTKKLHVPTKTLHAIHPNETLTLDTLTIKAFSSRHIAFDKPLILTTIQRSLKPKNLINALKLGYQNIQFSITDKDIYAYEITNKTTNIFLMGSANLDENTSYPENIDYLFYPFQGRSDINEYSVPLINRLHPSHILLTHYDDAFPPISSRVQTKDFIKAYPNAMEAPFNQYTDLST